MSHLHLCYFPILYLKGTCTLVIFLCKDCVSHFWLLCIIGALFIFLCKYCVLNAHARLSKFEFKTFDFFSRSTSLHFIQHLFPIINTTCTS